MNGTGWRIREADRADPRMLEGLTALLRDCVEGGASVSFMLPLEHGHALRFWSEVATGVEAGRRALLIASDEQGICGTVQLNLDLPDNQPHRADVTKLLVHRRARRRGLGAALMRGAEAAALARKRHLLVLDTVTGSDAARLYERLGWVRVGDIPEYALWPQGGYVSTTYFYRNLNPGPGSFLSRGNAPPDRPPLSKRTAPYG